MRTFQSIEQKRAAEQERVERVINQTAGHDVSNKYALVQTKQVLDLFQNEGFKITSAVATKPRLASKDGHQKHMIRLAHESMQLSGVNDSRPEVVLVNSHDGTTSIKMLIGIFRLVCSNGLIVGNTYGGFTTRHTGDALERVRDGINYVKTSLPQVAENIKHFQAITVSEQDARELTAKAVSMVLPENTISSDLNSAIRARRFDDQKTDLWTVYNRLQESLIRGGVKYISQTQEQVLPGIGEFKTVHKNNTTRAIRSIDRQIEVNRGLWDLVSEYSEAA